MSLLPSDIPLPQTTPPVTLEQVKAFAVASGDANPIHFSEVAARDAGLPGPVLHGMFVSGCFETFLEQMSGYVTTELRVRFVRPVPVGSALTISARRIDPSGNGNMLRLMASMGGGVLVAIAEACLQRAGEAKDLLDNAGGL